MTIEPTVFIATKKIIFLLKNIDLEQSLNEVASLLKIFFLSPGKVEPKEKVRVIKWLLKLEFCPHRVF